MRGRNRIDGPLWPFALAVLVQSLAARACIVAADERDAAEDLALAVARVCAHEASFRSPPDCLLIVQSTRRHGDTPAERLAWLERHSPRALTDDWTATLPADSDARPEHWPDHWDWPRWAATWRAMRESVRAIVVDGREPRRGWPCERDPDTWGGRVTDRRHIDAHRDVLEPLGCVGTLNEGFRWRR